MKKKAAILLSRQALRPCGNQAWIKRTFEAVKWAGENGFVILTSSGLQTWEFIIFSAEKCGLSQIIYLPSSDISDFHKNTAYLQNQFALKNETAFEPLFIKDSIKNSMKERDRVIARSADLLIPVSIRKNGEMESLINEMSGAGIGIEWSFQIPYEKPEKIKYEISDSQIDKNTGFDKGNYVIHWTRGSNGPWPTERLIDYYEAVLNSGTYPRDAFSTLRNILYTKAIKASSRHMPDKEKIVAFTGRIPLEFVKNMRWRSRYTEMSFEPYGIAIEIKAAINAGVRKVLYVNSRKDKNQIENWLIQSYGEKGCWIEEDEYRFKGDFNLNDFNRDQIIVICRNIEECDIVEKETGLRAISLCKK
jgi:hypothetical protein